MCAVHYRVTGSGGSVPGNLEIFRSPHRKITKRLRMRRLTRQDTYNQDTPPYEILPRLGSPVRRWDLVPFRYVDRFTPAESPSDTEGKALVVFTWNNSGLHQSPPPLSACLHHRQSRECGQGMGSQRNPPCNSVPYMMRVPLACWVPAFRTVPRPDTGRGGRYGESLSFCTSVRRTSILSSWRVRYCGLWRWLSSTISIRTSSAPRRLSTRR